MEALAHVTPLKQAFHFADHPTVATHQRKYNRGHNNLHVHANVIKSIRLAAGSPTVCYIHTHEAQKTWH
ncbi:hypothetical protein RSOLAG1IB_06932 [Rhizoctonia solani AG-1 IB]|uniref:Uncharacterized protein n=1 Tax=Thanatephorus cucumeris (strain AG1-IB / isolate 7/3/14) TaxID=1108050 RepID=A0A0B7FBG1_THACB|nr:hypothetical protein RSOLAG1IB_06932 [Rhizoctonia solani AG-1 IB]